MKINTPKLTTGKEKIYCPYCIYNYKYIPMVYDFHDGTWHCNNCNEILKKSDEPIHKGKLVAGNSQNFNKPYIRTVNFTKKVVPNTIQTYNNPMDAWNSE